MLNACIKCDCGGYLHLRFIPQGHTTVEQDDDFIAMYICDTCGKKIDEAELFPKT